MKSHQRKHLNVLIVPVLIVAMVCTSVPLTVFAESSSERNASILARQRSFPQASSRPVELIDRRTAQTKEYLNPDGSFTVESYSEPVHYKGTNGLFAEIDNQLVSSSDPSFQFKNRANSFQVAFGTGMAQGDLV